MAKIQTYEIFCGFQESNSEMKNWSYDYKYRKTKIYFDIKKNSFQVRIVMRSDKDADGFLKSPYFNDVIVKICIMHFIFFSEEQKITKLTIKVNEQENPYDFNESPLLYSLVTGRLLRVKIPEEWQNEAFIKNFLNTPKSKYDSRFSALFAFIIAKSKQYEIERFQNLWISLNGLYGFYATKIVKKILSIRRLQEAQEIQLFRFFNKWSSSTISKKENDQIGLKIQTALGKIGDQLPSSRAYFERSVAKEKIKENLVYTESGGKKTKKDLDIDCYGFMVLQFAYFLRCQFFHANRPLPLISIGESCECRILKFVNDLLEEYLSENLYKFFIDSFIDEQKIIIKDNDKAIKKFLLIIKESNNQEHPQ